METLIPLAILTILEPWMLMVVVLGFFAYKAWKSYLDDT